MDKFFAMGLDSRDHTTSGPSGRGFLCTASFASATENKIRPAGQITTRRRKPSRVPDAVQRSSCGSRNALLQRNERQFVVSWVGGTVPASLPARSPCSFIHAI